MTPPDDSSWNPLTFGERGVAVPFTSPMLAGARIRLINHRLEVVVPHPAGARGVYILALSSVAEFCVPTLHDARLLECLAGIQRLNPAAMRVAARAVAAEGLAGRAAAAAAVETEAVDRQAEQSFATSLLLSLTLEEEGSAGDAPEQRAAQAVLRLAGRTGRDADAVHCDVQRLARLAVACGLRGLAGEREVGAGRCRLLLDTVETTATGMLDWAESDGAATKPVCMQFGMAARTVRFAGDVVLKEIEALVDDPARLLNAWAAAPEVVAASLARPGWLLDGWESLCLPWQLAETDDQRAEAAAEAWLLMSPMPPEVHSWLGTAIDLVAFRSRHAVAFRPPAAASHALAAIARNERVRALAA